VDEERSPPFPELISFPSPPSSDDHFLLYQFCVWCFLSLNPMRPLHRSADFLLNSFSLESLLLRSPSLAGAFHAYLAFLQEGASVAEKEVLFSPPFFLPLFLFSLVLTHRWCLTRTSLLGRSPFSGCPVPFPFSRGSVLLSSQRWGVSRRMM